MSILVQVKCGNQFKSVSHTDLFFNRRVNFSGGQSVILRDSFEPGLDFDPPIKGEILFRGKALVATNKSLIGLSGEFSLRNENITIFGRADRNELKEADNYLVP